MFCAAKMTACPVAGKYKGVLQPMNARKEFLSKMEKNNSICLTTQEFPHHKMCSNARHLTETECAIAFG